MLELRITAFQYKRVGEDTGGDTDLGSWNLRDQERGSRLVADPRGLAAKSERGADPSQCPPSRILAILHRIVGPDSPWTRSCAILSAPCSSLVIRSW